MKYVENAWYVAGWASEFADQPVKITVLEQELVLYRKTDGQVCALRDLCPHKLLPLSMGKVDGDTIQCGYHGTVFNAQGHCIRVPGQEIIPKRQCVDVFPVHEKNNIVWVWMGDADQADTSQVFDLPQFHDKTWRAHHGDALHIESNYLNVAENLVDPAHVSFVHPTTLGNAQSEDVPVHVDTAGETITAWRWIRDAPPVGFFKELGGFDGHVDRWHYYYLHLPSTAVIDFGSADAALEIAEEDREQGMRIFALHFLTPVNATHTIDRWMHIRNRAIDDNSIGDRMNALFRIAFDEDKVILEAIQEQETRLAAAEKPTQKPLRLAIDKGPNEYRKRIERLQQ
ncbi:vanillate O-demethylase oxygenase [Chromatiales bacterium (ex Bugula neritina AB1)]|nr:vanillate O-demethylase oxygenase [Chromatiales bacterium (ex Bugula neritina AB1)]